MSETILANVTSESEFQSGLTAACGPCAAAVAARWADRSLTTPRTYDLYQAMVARALCSANGASTASGLQTALSGLGYILVSPNTGESVTAFSARLAGTCTIVLEVSNGQALKDTLTGATEDAVNLQYHYVCLVGRNTGGPSTRPLPPTLTSLPAGYWVADGDNNTQNPIINGARVHRGLNGDLVYYSDATIAAAKPYSAFAVLARKVGPMVPSGWTDDAAAGILTAPNGQHVHGGFRQYLLNVPGGWAAEDLPDSAELRVLELEIGTPSHGPGVTQYFHYSQLALPDDPQHHSVYRVFVGRDALAMRTKIDLLNAQISALQSQANPDATAAMLALKKALGL
ncbi:MAG TPA: hypothetical protein VFN11_20760 [Ktedonobacterales bacterium]|nr:hypothetical protein [Ktedonobacterales bacterium]